MIEELTVHEQGRMHVVQPFLSDILRSFSDRNLESERKEYVTAGTSDPPSDLKGRHIRL